MGVGRVATQAVGQGVERGRQRGRGGESVAERAERAPEVERGFKNEEKKDEQKSN